MRKRYVAGFLILLVVAVLLSYFQGTLFLHAKLLGVQYSAARAGSQKAALVVGDSLVELATFSPTMCGRPVINAGLTGARASDVLWLLDKLGSSQFSAALIIISVGINDVIAPDHQPFAETYPEIVRRARTLADKVFVVLPAPVADTGSIAGNVDRSRLPGILQTIRRAAQDHSVSIIDVGALDARGSPWKEDGVHLNPDGYIPWISAIENAVNRDCS